MKLVIDSSVFVAAFREEEPHSREAFRILEQLEDETISAVIPVSVILEVVAAIRRRTGDDDLARSVSEKLLSFATISWIDINTFRMARLLELASTSGLRGMDLLIVGIAREFGLPMITLDQEMSEIARPYVEVLEIGSF